MVERLNRVVAAIDRFNSQDPSTIEVGGRERPSELVYGERLSAWVKKRLPEASEALRIAARGQHIGRWMIPRTNYPMDRGGYLRWREDLKRFHASTVAGLMASEGYSTEEIDRVRTLMLKKNLAPDPEGQALEDALCLLFLETQFDQLAEKTPEDKMIEILRKTWKKMSEKGRSMALALPFTPPQKKLIQAALSSSH